MIQFCLIEALSARLQKSRSDVAERHEATEAALDKARAAVAQAVR